MRNRGGKIYVTVIFFIFFIGSSLLFTVCKTRADYQTYTYSDHRYSISFEYPKEFTAPAHNYYATENIIQNEFENDLNASFIFMPVDLGNSNYISPCKYNTAEFEACDNTAQLLNQEQLIKHENLTGLNNEYGISYEDDLIGRSYSLSVELPENASPALHKKIKHTIKSFKIEDSFTNTSDWRSVNFDSTLTLKFPSGTDVLQEGESLYVDDDHRYSFLVERIEPETSEYDLWKDQYFYILDNEPLYKVKIDFINYQTLPQEKIETKVQATLYVDGSIYIIQSGEIKGVLNDEKISTLSSEITVLNDVYIKPQSDAYKYLEYLKKVVELIEIDRSNITK